MMFIGQRGKELGNAVPLTLTYTGPLTTGTVVTAAPSAGWAVSGNQWTRDNVDIGGSTGTTYSVTVPDAGKLLGCRVALGASSFTAVLAIPALSTLPGQVSFDGLLAAFDGLTLQFV